jgi:hypothetical protein
VQGDIPVAHDDLAKKVDAMVKVLMLVGNGVRIVIVVGVVGLANLVDAVKRVKDVESRKVAPCVILQGY